MTTLGILGIGHLSEHLVAGWMRSADAPELLLSPRNAEKAQALAERYGLRVVANNQALVDQSEAVLLSVRPWHALEVVNSLSWRRGQTLISAVAGLPLSDIQAAAPQTKVTRVMPIIAAAVGESPTTLYPDDALTRALFAPLGPVVAVPDEARFDAANIAHCYYGCLYALMEQAETVMAEAGLDPASARLLASQATRAAATMARDHHREPLDETTAAIATEGSFTKLGLDHLQQREALSAWAEACRVIHRAIREA